MVGKKENTFNYRLLEKNICPYCNATVSLVEVHCENCGFPLSGTDKEKAVFIGQQTLRKSKIDNSAQMIHKTRIILYVVAGFQVLDGLLAYFMFNSVIDLILHLIIAGILATFSFLSPKKPILFVSLALGVIVCYYLLLYLVNPMFFFNGMLWKCAIMMALSYTLYDAVESHLLKKKYKL